MRKQKNIDWIKAVIIIFSIFLITFSSSFMLFLFNILWVIMGFYSYYVLFEKECEDK